MSGDSRWGRGSGDGDGVHPGPEDLALAALPAESADPAVAAHLAGCALCRRHVGALSRTVALAKDGSTEADAQPVPERIWAAIAAEIGPGLESVTGPPIPQAADGVGASSGPTDDEHRHRPADTVRAGGATPPPSAAPPSVARPTRSWRAAAAVLVALAVGVGVGVGVDRAVGPRQGPATVVAQLLPVGAVDPTGRGTLTSVEHDGVRTMAVHLTGVTDPAGADFLEAWLMNPATRQIVALGALTRDGAGYDGSFTVPANLPMDRLTVVDVSAERYDGDPGHSGVSLLRGALV